MVQDNFRELIEASYSNKMCTTTKDTAFLSCNAEYLVSPSCTNVFSLCSHCCLFLFTRWRMIRD